MTSDDAQFTRHVALHNRRLLSFVTGEVLESAEHLRDALGEVSHQSLQESQVPFTVVNPIISPVRYYGIYLDLIYICVVFRVWGHDFSGSGESSDQAPPCHSSSWEVQPVLRSGHGIDTRACTITEGEGSQTHFVFHEWQVS